MPFIPAAVASGDAGDPIGWPQAELAHFRTPRRTPEGVGVVGEVDDDCRPPNDVPIGHSVGMGQRRYGSVVEWLFRNRKTGRITIAQFPNAALWLFVAAAVLQRLLDPSGMLRTGLTLIAAGALLWWAVDELVRGVNPWRRLLGGAVIATQAARLVT